MAGGQRLRAQGADAGAAAGAAAGGGVTALAADAEPVDDGKLMLRLGVIMRRVLPREAIRANRV